MKTENCLNGTNKYIDFYVLYEKKKKMLMEERQNTHR